MRFIFWTQTYLDVIELQDRIRELLDLMLEEVNDHKIA